MHWPETMDPMSQQPTVERAAAAGNGTPEVGDLDETIQVISSFGILHATGPSIPNVHV